MKKIIFIAVVALGFAITAKAQTPKAQWITIKSANLKCWECKTLLEQYLKRANASQMEMGMIQWRINLMQGEIRIQYWPDRTNPSYIKTTIANAGFDAGELKQGAKVVDPKDEIKATEDAYKLLPPNCKRAEDGGGPKKGKPCHMEPQR